MALIQESMKKKKTVKLTQKQYDLIKENVDMQSKPIEKPNVLQFGQFITEAINSFFAEGAGELNIPESIKAMGVKPSELKYKLLKDKVINVVEGEEKDSYKFNPKGFGEWCSKYYNELVANEKPEKELTEDYDYPYEESRPKPNYGQIYKGGEAYDDGDHTDYPEEDREDDYEYEENTSVDIVAVNTGIDEVIVIKYEGHIVLFANENMERYVMMDIEQVAFNIIEGYVKGYEGVNVNPLNQDAKAFANGDAMFLMVTPDNVKKAMMALDMAFGFLGKIPQILESIFSNDEEIMEMTTTGSVGGSYETNKIWAKDPKNPRMGKEPMIKGGQFINEDLVFKKDTPNERIVLYSDAATLTAKNGETARPAYMIKQHGFKWDKGLNAYVSPLDNFEQALQLKEKLFKCKQVFEILSDLEEYVHQLPDVPADVIATGEKLGAKTTRKDEIEASIENFYKDLQNDLDGNKYVQFSVDYLKFVSKFVDKFKKDYSPKNLMLIYLQKPNAKAVGTMLDWEKVDRKVRKGARGIMLYKPQMYKAAIDKDKVGTSADNDENYEEKIKFGTFFVFDVSDTVAKDGSEDPTELVNHWQPSNDPNEDAQFLAEKLKEVISEDGIKLTFDDSRGGEGGFSAGKWINISNGTQGERLFSVLIHEYAHELIHQRTGTYFKKDVKLSTDVKEIHAEGVAVALMNYFDFDITPNKVYLEGWGKMGAAIKDHVGIMTAVASDILKKLLAKVEEVKTA